jgi:thiol-disulfide isomerase/thioredoxin
MNGWAINVGQTAPDFNLPDLQNNSIQNLSQFRGKVIYLDFWASWCAPCRTSFPLLNQLYEKLRQQNFAVLAVNLDEDKANAEKFLREIPVNFKVLNDSDGKVSDQFVVDTMPTSFLIDKNGVVQKIHHGFVSDDIKEIEVKVNELIQQK